MRSVLLSNVVRFTVMVKKLVVRVKRTNMRGGITSDIRRPTDRTEEEEEEKEFAVRLKSEGSSSSTSQGTKERSCDRKTPVR